MLEGVEISLIVMNFSVLIKIIKNDNVLIFRYRVPVHVATIQRLPTQ